MLLGEHYPGQGVSDFHGGVAPDMEILFLGSNQFSHFSGKNLMGLGSLFGLDLGDNQLTNFDATTFQAVTPQLYLLLNDNYLTTYPEIEFGMYQNVFLFLNNNKFRSLPVEEYASQNINPYGTVLYLPDNCI